LQEGLYEAWLDAPAANSHDFMRQFPADRLVATPEPMAAKVRSIKVKPTQEADQGGLF
jgi:putative SOS response-associated peptidase YedK